MKNASAMYASAIPQHRPGNQQVLAAEQPQLPEGS